MREARKVILDDDGFSIAQWMIVQAPDTEVLGVTTVAGNCWVKECVAHALRGLELVGRTDVPALAGATFPLVNTEKTTELWEALYGKLIWKGAWMKKWVESTVQSPPQYHASDVVPDLPEGNPTTQASSEIAAMFMIRKVHEFPGQVSIIATGPLTNLALAQRLDPQFRSAREGTGLHGREPESASKSCRACRPSGLRASTSTHHGGSSIFVSTPRRRASRCARLGRRSSWCPSIRPLQPSSERTCCVGCQPATPRSPKCSGSVKRAFRCGTRSRARSGSIQN